MRRSILICLFIGAVLGITAVTHLTTAPSAAAAPEIPFAINAAADSCEGATLIPSLPWGDHTAFTNQLTESPTDPALSCIWGNPTRPQGYRTAWYKFVAPYSAEVTIDTFYSDYDTVLAVYSGSCGSQNLVEVACNDDHQGFSSKVSLVVKKGVTYYIEVADWQFDVYGSDLNIAVLINPVDSQWVFEGNMPIPRSRHSVVASGQYLYVIGGETEMGNDPILTPDLQRFNTENNGWTTWDPMPGSGYANTSAAVVNGSIYVPSGFTGNTTAYNGTHYVYNIAQNLWTTGATAPWPSGRPLAWGTAVALPSTLFPAGYVYIGGTPDQPPFEAYADSNTPAVPSDTALFYNPNSDSWSSSTIPSLSVARYAHTAAWVGDRLCVVGGLGINTEGTGNILLTGGECYRPGFGWQTISDLNYPRFNAGSAVGPDGHWYVFGGLDGGDPANNIAPRPVETTEYYDVDTDTWHALTINYALGGIPSNPARAWAQGAFVGNDLWVMGGNIDGSVGPVFSGIERLSRPTPSLFLPAIFHNLKTPANDTLETAYGLSLNQPQFHTFDGTVDYYDTYYFDLNATTGVTVRLSDIPISGDIASNYDLYLYNDNKVLRGSSQNPSNLDDFIPLNLTPGRYYVIVERVYPAGDPSTKPYRIIVEGS